MFQEEKILKLETVRNDVVTIFKLCLAQREKRECKEKASLRAGPYCWYCRTHFSLPTE